MRQLSRSLPCHIAGVLWVGALWLAWLALVSLALAGCGATVAPKQTPSLEDGKSATTIEGTVEDARPSEAAVVVEEPPATGEFANGPPSETDQTSVLIPPQVKDPIVVALLLPLSGRHAALGRALKDAAFLALFELGNPRLVVLPRDTGGTAAGAQAAAEQALRDGAQLILGPLFRDAVLGAAPVARAQGVNIIAFSTDRSVAGDGVYLLGFTLQQQVARVVRYANKQGLARFAALAPDSPYGYAIVAALQETVAQLGAEVTGIQFYAPDGSNAAEAVIQLGEFEQRKWQRKQRLRELASQSGRAAKLERSRLKEAETYGELPFDALILPEGGQVLKAVAPLLPYYDVDGVRILGTGLWDDHATTREPALIGGWFAAPVPAAAHDFQRRFKAAYGRAAPRIATLAYDATALAAVLAAGERGPRFDGETLTTASGFAGNDGIFRFRENGVAERGLAILEVSAEGFQVIDNAPQSFESLVFDRRPGS